VSPLQGFETSGLPFTQGVALGYSVLPVQGNQKYSICIEIASLRSQ